MKFKGQPVINTNIEYVVIPRKTGDIVFVAKPVLNLDDFEKIYVEPKPPTITYPDATGKPPEKDFKDEVYRQKLTDFYVARMHWVILISLKDSPDIEWETVNMADPTTYANYIDELKAAQFLTAEINAITTAVDTVNALDERQMEAARASFLASLQAKEAA